jgi:copper chaperone CopZ
MAIRSETIQVGGVRCEQCVMRLGAALEPLEGIESANANLLGRLDISWDETRLPRDQLLAAISRAGFQPEAARE